VWLLVALAAQPVAVFGYALAYRQMARVEGGPELHPAWAGALTAVGFGAFLVKGGFAFDYGMFRRSRLQPGEAQRRVFGLGALEYAVLAPAAWASALVLLLTAVKADPSVTVSWFIGLPVGALVAIGILTRRNQWAERGGRRSRVANALSSVSLLWPLVRQRRHWSGVVGMALYWLGEIASLWAGLRAFGWPASILRPSSPLPRATPSLVAHFPWPAQGSPRCSFPSPSGGWGSR
jgi:hypothetical protein